MTIVRITYNLKNNFYLKVKNLLRIVIIRFCDMLTQIPAYFNWEVAFAAKIRMDSLEMAMMRTLGPMSSTGSSQNASQDKTMTMAAGMADLK